MAQALTVLLFAGGLVAWNVYQYRSSGGRQNSTLWLAVTATTVAALFLLAGAFGFELDRHERFLSRGAWTGSVIWWEVGVGIVVAILATRLWRLGLDELARRPNHR